MTASVVPDSGIVTSTLTTMLSLRLTSKSLPRPPARNCPSTLTRKWLTLPSCRQMLDMRSPSSLPLNTYKVFVLLPMVDISVSNLTVSAENDKRAEGSVVNESNSPQDTRCASVKTSAT